MDVNEELKFLYIFKKNKLGWGGGGRGWGGLGEWSGWGGGPRIEVFVKIQNKKIGGGVWGGGGRVGGQGGCK